MDRKSLILLVAALSCSAQAEVYQCAHGKYQAVPCDENSQALDLSHVGSVVESGVTSQASVDAQGSVSDKKAEISAYVRNQSIQREIKSLEDQRRKALLKRDRSLKNLRDSRQYANNNLAGATWEQSLAQEMTAVTQEADTMVSTIDRQIDALKREISP